MRDITKAQRVGERVGRDNAAEHRADRARGRREVYESTVSRDRSEPDLMPIGDHDGSERERERDEREHTGN